MLLQVSVTSLLLREETDSQTFLSFASLFLATPVAASASPYNFISFGTAHFTAQACAFSPACCTASSAATHAPCCQPAHLPWAGQDGQVPQSRWDDVTRLLLWLLCPLWYPRGTLLVLSRGWIWLILVPNVLITIVFIFVPQKFQESFSPLF